jgi:hypothetical protein
LESGSSIKKTCGEHDGATHGDTLTLATGERLRLAVEELLQAQPVCGLLDTLLALGLGDPSHLQGKGHVVAHSHMGV